MKQKEIIAEGKLILTNDPGGLRRGPKFSRRHREGSHRSRTGVVHSENGPQQLIQGLGDRQVKLEAQNLDLQKARDRAEVLLKREIVRRQKVEKSFKKSEEQQSRLLEQSRQMQEQLRDVSRLVLQAQEEERKKISRELHDIIAQTLTSINVRLANLKKEAALNTKGVEVTINRTQELVERSVEVVHRFARELRPPVLDDLGLIPALHTFMKDFKEATGIHVSLSAFAAIEQVKGDKRTVLYRVVQEALVNVARHANASRAQVKIQKLGDSVCMEIKDNGKGFEEGRVLRSKARKRLGLLGMRERVEMVGGTFSIESSPGKGTTVRAKIPFGGSGGERPGGGL